jgi:hypothetical protein
MTKLPEDLHRILYQWFTSRLFVLCVLHDLHDKVKGSADAHPLFKDVPRRHMEATLASNGLSNEVIQTIQTTPRPSLDGASSEPSALAHHWFRSRHFVLGSLHNLNGGLKAFGDFNPLSKVVVLKQIESILASNGLSKELIQEIQTAPTSDAPAVSLDRATTTPLVEPPVDNLVVLEESPTTLDTLIDNAAASSSSSSPRDVALSVNDNATHTPVFERFTLDQLEKTYGYKPFDMKVSNHRMMCWLVDGNPELYIKLAQSTKVVLLSKPKEEQKLVDSLRYRIPVYMGNIMRPENGFDFYNRNVYKQLTGVTIEEAVAKIDTSIRYAICGRVATDLAASFNQPPVYMTHVWGVDLGKETTNDYRMYVEKDERGATRLKREDYESRVKELTDLIIASSIYAMQDAKTEECDLYVPGVGIGEFLKALKSIVDDGDGNEIEVESHDSKWAKITFFTCLAGSYMAVHGAYPNLRLMYCDWTGLNLSRRCKELVESLPATFVIQQKGDMFQYLRDRHRISTGSGDNPKSPCAIGVNAWDPISYIGNGMCRDNSLDGYVVSGGNKKRPFGKDFPNSSFMQNPLVMPHLMSTASWFIAK